MLKYLDSRVVRYSAVAVVLCSLVFLQGWTQVKLNRLTSELEAAQIDVATLESKLEEVRLASSAINFEVDKLKGSVAIIDGAVNAEGKRKQRILKVKTMIRELSMKEGLKDAQGLEPSQLSEMATAIVDRADAEHIPVALLMALIRQESAFNPEAISKKGAQGLTQVMPTTADDIKQWTQRSYYEPFRISHNVHFGAYYLGRMLRKFGWDKSKAVMAYNGGPEAVASWSAGVGKLWPETIDYEKQVMAFSRKYESLGVN